MHSSCCFERWQCVNCCADSQQARVGVDVPCQFQGAAPHGDLGGSHRHGLEGESWCRVSAEKGAQPVLVHEMGVGAVTVTAFHDAGEGEAGGRIGDSRN